MKNVAIAVLLLACLAMGFALFRRDPSRDDVARLSLQLQCGKGDVAACQKHLELTRDRCDQGDADGCVLLGMIHQGGTRVPKDEARAVSLFEKACDSGSGSGCWYLGMAVQQGQGVPQDLERARKAHERSCTLRHENGCISLGDLYSRPGPLNSSEKALAAYDAACALPYKGGCDRAAALRK